ncbi:MAG: helix-turn-helix domain-containing protein [Methylobacterium sp.]|uniref:helix-turn-helix domain-containing protein n=1 Tax=Methylobacterium sp. TaxID=409 RepID=UPI00258D9AAB|nr:helix-turn-helix transcriptional regulator [Methylobacterium sp.]MBY0297449.1 helix-turn-helix domain-containing protein [Methylobacterium sp.]
MRATTPRRSLGEHIKTRRKRLGILQAELAHAVGCDNRTISRFERGRSVPADLLPRLATALGLPVEDLTSDVGQIEPTRDEIEVLTVFRTLPDSGRAYVRGLMLGLKDGSVTR